MTVSIMDNFAEMGWLELQSKYLSVWVISVDCGFNGVRSGSGQGI